MFRILFGVLLGTSVSLGAIGESMAWPIAAGMNATVEDMVINVEVKKPKGANAGAKSTNVNRNTNINKNANVKKNTNVNRNTNVNKNTNVNRNTNVNVNRNANVNVVRPVRGWAPRPYYGTIVAGVALGTVVAVTAAGMAPAAPGPNMCWFWSDPNQSHGYWDYCSGP